MGKEENQGMGLGEKLGVGEGSKYESAGETSFTRWKTPAAPAKTEDFGFDLWEDEGGFSGMPYEIETDIVREGNVCHDSEGDHGRELIGRVLEKIEGGEAWTGEELGSELIADLKSYWRDVR